MKTTRRKTFSFKIVESSKEFLVGTFIDKPAFTYDEAVWEIEALFFGAGFDELDFEYDHESGIGTMKAFAS